MGNYIIKGETLKRYHSGLSSVEESAAVEAWLEETEEEIIFAHPESEEDEINSALWAVIHQTTILKERKRRTLKLWQHRLAIAASLLITILCAFLVYNTKLSGDTSTLVRINNFGGQTAKIENIDGLVLTALPRGSIDGQIGLNSGKVAFCDVMLIENKSVKDFSLDFASNCSGNHAISKKFICKKGITYVALRMSRISPDIIVVDQRYMEDFLPLNVAMRINKDLQSI